CLVPGQCCAHALLAFSRYENLCSGRLAQLGSPIVGMPAPGWYVSRIHFPRYKVPVTLYKPAVSKLDTPCQVWQNQASFYAPIAQRIERWPPEPKAQVRLLVGVLFLSSACSSSIRLLRFRSAFQSPWQSDVEGAVLFRTHVRIVPHFTTRHNPAHVNDTLRNGRLARECSRYRSGDTPTPALAQPFPSRQWNAPRGKRVRAAYAAWKEGPLPLIAGYRGDGPFSCLLPWRFQAGAFLGFRL